MSDPRLVGRRWDPTRLAVSVALGIATALLLFTLSAAWIAAHRRIPLLTGGLCADGVNPVVLNGGQGFDPWTGVANPMIVRTCDGQLQSTPMGGAAVPVEIGFLPGFVGGLWVVGAVRRRRTAPAS